VGKRGLFGDRPYATEAFCGFIAPQDDQVIAHSSVEILELDSAELEAASRVDVEIASLLLESVTARAQFLERRLLWQFTTPVLARAAATLRDLICFESTGSDPVNGFQGLQVRLSFKPKPLTGPDLAPSITGPDPIDRMFFGRDRGGETAAILMSILASAKRHGIEPFQYVHQLLIARPSADVDLRSLLPDVWIAAHPEHFLQYRRDEAEAAARARKRRREKRRARSKSGFPEARGPEPFRQK
jgi:hypothetical protein